MAERNRGCTTGRERGVRSRGSSSGLQGNETTSRGLPQGAPESPVIFTMTMEMVLRDLITSWIARKTGMETGRLSIGCDLLCGRCGAGCCVGGCCGSDGGRGHCKIERCRSECWCTENTLDELTEDGRQKHHGGRTGGCVVGGSLGICEIEGVSGRECKTCDRAQISSSQQMSGEVETCF